LRRIPGVVVSALVLAAAPLRAQQVRTSVDIGAVTVRYANTMDVSMVSVAPTLTVLGQHGFLGASGVLGSASMQGAAVASYLTSMEAPLAVELATTIGGSLANASTTQQAQLTARLHLRRMLGGAVVGTWAGAGVGRVGDGSTHRATLVREVGAWTQLGDLALSVTHTPTDAADGIRYADTQGTARWRGQRIDLDGVVGVRSGTARVSGIDDPGRWASLTVTAHLTDRLALVAGGGSYPLDLLQGFPAGRFTTIGLRLSGGAASRAAASSSAARAPVTAASTEAAAPTVDAEMTILLRPVADGRWELRLRSDGAQRIELQGDPTGWAPVAMAGDGSGWFRLVLPLATGVHEVVVRRDGGAWVAPTGLAPRRDEFAGVTGLLVVP